MKNTEVIAICNHKGGVSKTTNAMHLAAALGERGHKCLLIDLDGNLGLTQSFDIPLTTIGTFHMLLREEKATDVIITPEMEQERASRPGEMITLPKNVDIIPANRRLERFDEEFAASEDEEMEFMAPMDTLIQPLESLQGLYDYIVLDTSPITGSLTKAAYKSARWIIFSSTAEKLSVEALKRSRRDLIAATKVNPELRLLGVLMSQVQYTRKLERAYITKVKKDLEAAGDFGLFESVIPTRAVVGKASQMARTLFEYEPESREMQATNEVRDLYRSVAQEVEKRIAKAEKIEAPKDETLSDEPVTEAVVNG